MAMKVPKDGFVICNPDDKNIADVILDINAKVINWNDYFSNKLIPITEVNTDYGKIKIYKSISNKIGRAHV